MTPEEIRLQELMRLLFEANATIAALVSGQVDAVIDAKTQTPVMVSTAQVALRESEARYRRIVETTNEGILTTDVDAIITFVNHPLTEMLGYSDTELLGRSLYALLPTAAHTDTSSRVERSRDDIAEQVEVAFLRKDGTELWALIKTTRIRGDDGTYIGWLAMLTDRTEHRSREHALRKSEEQYRQIVEITTDGILKIDQDARITFVNRRFAQMLGYEAAQVIDISVFGLMSGTAEGLALSAMNPQASSLDSIDTTFRHKDGHDIAVNIAGSRILDADGVQTGYLGVVRDITERKKLQSQLMVSDRMASVGTLAAGVAHEINNPLAAVLANLDSVLDATVKMTEAQATSPTWFREEVRIPLDEAREAAQRVRLIVRDLKIFSRTPTEELGGVVDVRTIMESSLRMAWNEVRHRARLVKNYGALPKIAANEARLGQVFLNLVVNAAQSIREGDAEHNEIRIETRLDGMRAVIEITDTGMGIPPEIVGRIFDAFFTTKAIGVGTGLGLAICQRIITDMAGELTVRSELGKGTTFSVALPIAPAHVALPAAPAVAVAPIAGARVGRILVVDDEALVGISVKRILRAHDVHMLNSAKEALARCVAGEAYDLILCDLMMPDMTGMELHGELLRACPELAGRMIFMTGGAFTPEAREFLSATEDHVEKPFDSAGLRALVQRRLAGAEVSRTSSKIPTD
ncbi:MAG: PAS domain S-box protein [Myxococcota bacterium]|nr:PAS domain S-box protein [Myxococcota bacterium]